MTTTQLIAHCEARLNQATTYHRPHPSDVARTRPLAPAASSNHSGGDTLTRGGVVMPSDILDA